MSRVACLRIEVRPSPDTGDDETCLLADGEDVLLRFGDEGMMGVDPRDLLVARSPLLPRVTPCTAMVGRCCCGDVGCGNIEIVVAAEGEVVTWRRGDGTEVVRFAFDQYVAEVERAVDELGTRDA